MGRISFGIGDGYVIYAGVKLYVFPTNGIKSNKSSIIIVGLSFFTVIISE